eukprot:14227851-Alexandrium_andersonii.AAC.1
MSAGERPQGPRKKRLQGGRRQALGQGALRGHEAGLPEYHPSHRPPPSGEWEPRSPRPHRCQRTRPRRRP